MSAHVANAIQQCKAPLAFECMCMCVCVVVRECMYDCSCSGCVHDNFNHDRQRIILGLYTRLAGIEFVVEILKASCTRVRACVREWKLFRCFLALARAHARVLERKLLILGLGLGTRAKTIALSHTCSTAQRCIYPAYFVRDIVNHPRNTLGSRVCLRTRPSGSEAEYAKYNISKQTKSFCVRCLCVWGGCFCMRGVGDDDDDDDDGDTQQRR